MAPVLNARHAVAATPFVKWAGGKTQLLPQLSALAPQVYRSYFEPFAGSGALFFKLQPQSAVLNDANEELINCYRVIRDSVEELIEALAAHRNEEAYFYNIRAVDPARLSDIERASRLIFLNRTCFNGLYRVNQKGKFNAPYGRYVNPNICNAVNLRNVSAVLQDVTLLSDDYQFVASQAEAGDFIYFDPPYLPISKYSDFKRYTKKFFYTEDHIQLAETFKTLDRRGCLVMLSNAHHPMILELFKDYRIEVVMAKRLINKDATLRGGVPECIIMNY